MFEQIRNSQASKVALFVGVCIIFAFVLFSQSADKKVTKAELKLKSEEPYVDEFPGDIMVGGLGAIHEKDDEVDEAVNAIKPELEEKTGAKFESIDILSYKHQIVAGKNFFVKVKAKAVDAEEKIMHLRIYRDLQKNFELYGYQVDKKLEDEIVHFQ